MTIHYHGTPISPRSKLQLMQGKHLCVSFAAPADVVQAHRIAQSVMLDNGAYSHWRLGKPADWPGYYAFCEKWLSTPTTWAVIPDVIAGDEITQNELLKQWPFHHRGAPVWHLHEPIERLLFLCDRWPRVCIGSSGEYEKVLSTSWRSRMDLAINELSKRYRHMPWLHMLRGMACARERWPFASLDSTDIACNHHRAGNCPRAMADRWDAIQCSPWRSGTLLAE